MEDGREYRRQRDCLTWAEPPQGSPPDIAEDVLADVSPNLRRLLSALEAAIMAAGERKAADAATIAALHEQLDTERTRGNRAGAAVAAERSRVDAAHDRLDGLQTHLVAAVEAAEQARRQMQEAQHRADTERARADALQDRVEDLDARLTDAQARLATARDQAIEAEALAERLPMGRLARLRRAWRDH